MLNNSGSKVSPLIPESVTQLLKRVTSFTYDHGDIFAIFLKIGLIFTNGGMVSPNKNPQCFKDSMLSQMSFTMARRGMERNIPGIPHRAFPAITTTIAKSALIFTFEATILGTM